MRCAGLRCVSIAIDDGRVLGEERGDMSDWPPRVGAAAILYRPLLLEWDARYDRA